MSAQSPSEVGEEERRYFRHMLLIIDHARSQWRCWSPASSTESANGITTCREGVRRTRSRPHKLSQQGARRSQRSRYAFRLGWSGTFGGLLPIASCRASGLAAHTVFATRAFLSDIEPHTEWSVASDCRLCLRGAMPVTSATSLTRRRDASRTRPPLLSSLSQLPKVRKREPEPNQAR